MGALSRTRNGEVLSLNLAGTASGSAIAVSSGAGAPAVVIVESGTEIDGTNVSGVLTGDVTFDVALKQQGYAGHGALTLFKNTMALELTTPNGASASLDPSGALLISYADGSREAAQHPMTASLEGGGTTTGPLTYGTPVRNAAPTGKVPTVVSHSADNRPAGAIGPSHWGIRASNLYFNGISGQAAYWPSPTGAAAQPPGRCPPGAPPPAASPSRRCSRRRPTRSGLARPRSTTRAPWWATRWSPRWAAPP